MQPFSFFFCWLFVGGRGGGDLGSGSGSKFNRAARVGLGQTISGTGRVRASVLSPCRPLRAPNARSCHCNQLYLDYKTCPSKLVCTSVTLASFIQREQ